MENSSFISNRFSPGNVVPVFFAGRKQETTKFLRLLQQFATSYPLGCPRHLHFLTGEHGIGKTTFLMRLKKCLYEEWFDYIPLFTSFAEHADDFSGFSKALIEEFENSIAQSPFRRERLLKFFKNKGWQRSLIRTFPRLAQYSAQLLLIEAKPLSLRNFFKTLTEAYKNPETLQELLLVLNFLAKECGLFIFWAIDGFDSVRFVPELLEIMESALGEIEKYNRRYFVVLEMESHEFSSLIESIESEPGGGMSPIFERHSLVSFDTDNVAQYADLLMNRIHGHDGLCFANIFPEIDVKYTLNLIQSRCQSQFMVVCVPCAMAQDMVQYLQQTTQWLSEKIKTMKNEQGELFDLRQAPDTLRRIKEELSEENFLDNALVSFEKFMVRMDAHLKSSLPDTSLLIFLENFEQLIASGGEEVAGKIGTVKSKKGDTLVYKSKFIAPSASFLKFFSTLEHLAHSLSKISIVPVTALHEFEYKNQENRIFFQIPVLKLDPLVKDEALHLVKETAARSGVILENEIASDLYSRVSGHPLSLQYYGYYLLSRIQESIAPEEIELVKNSVLTVYNPIQYAKCQKLSPGPDGRTRISMQYSFYKHIVPDSIEELYKKLLFEIRTRIGRNLLEILSQSEVAVPLAGLLSPVKLMYPEINESDIVAILKELEKNKIVVQSGPKYQIAHPALKSFLTRLFLKKQGQEKEHGTQTTRNRLRPVFNFGTRKLAPSGKPTAPTKIAYNVPVPPEIGGDSFMKSAMDWVQNGQLPSITLMRKLSGRMSIRESDPSFKETMHYVYILCQRLLKKLSLPMELAQAVSIFKDQLSLSVEQQGVPDLYFALEQTFFGENTIQETLQRKDHLSLCKLYHVKYMVTGHATDLENAIQYLFESFLNSPEDQKTWEYGSEMAFHLTQLEDKLPDAETIRTMMKWMQNLVELEKLKNHEAFKQRIIAFTPNVVPREFHAYFLRYLHLIAEKRTGLAQTALKMIGFYGEALEEPQIAMLIKKVRQNDVHSKSAIDALIRATYNFNEPQRQDTITLLQSFLMQDPDCVVGPHLLQKMAESHFAFSPDDLASFFYGFIKNEAYGERKIKACHALTQIARACSEETRQEIVSFLEEEYAGSLPGNHPALLSSLDSLISLLGECSESFFNAFLSSASDERLGAFATTSLISTVYPALHKDHRKRMNESMKQWLLDGKAKRREKAIAGLSFFYDDLPDPEIAVAPLVRDPLSFRFLLNPRILLLMHRLNGKDRLMLWNRLVDFASSALHAQDAVECRALPTLAQISCFFSYEETDSLAEILEEGVNLHPETLVMTLNQSHSFLPYMRREKSESIQLQYIDWIKRRTISSRQTAGILTYFSCLSESQVKISNQEAFFAHLYEQMISDPENLLEHGLKFFGNVWAAIPEDLASCIYRDAVSLLAFPEYVESTAAFLVKNFGEIPEFAYWGSLYQFESPSAPIVFALYDLFPQLFQEDPRIAENYARYIAADPCFGRLRMAEFYREIGLSERVNELIDWVLRNAPSDFVKVRALQQKREWELSQNKGIQANETLSQIVALSC